MLRLSPCVHSRKSASSCYHMVRIWQRCYAVSPFLYLSLSLGSGAGGRWVRLELQVRHRLYRHSSRWYRHRICNPTGAQCWWLSKFLPFQNVALLMLVLIADYVVAGHFKQLVHVTIPMGLCCIIFCRFSIHRKVWRSRLQNAYCEMRESDHSSFIYCFRGA